MTTDHQQITHDAIAACTKYADNGAWDSGIGDGPAFESDAEPDPDLVNRCTGLGLTAVQELNDLLNCFGAAVTGVEYTCTQNDVIASFTIRVGHDTGILMISPAHHPDGGILRLTRDSLAAVQELRRLQGIEGAPRPVAP